MSKRDRGLAEGVYEDVVTDALAEALARRPETVVAVEQPLEIGSSHVALSRHVARELERWLDAMKGDDRIVRQVELVNRLLDHLERAREHGQGIAEPARVLWALSSTSPPPRPSTPLAQSTALTRARGEPTLGHELATEIASADRIDAIVAFVTMGGLRALREAIEGACRRGARLRILTTVFTGTTEVRALEYLARLPGAEVRVSYDTRRTRLHAKAWLFRRDTGLHTAYVGSANLTHTALGSGHEWTLKASAVDLPHVVDKLAGSFDSCWGDAEFERFDPGDAEQVQRLRDALGGAKSQDASTPLLLSLRPHAFQEEILDRLEAERRLHGRWRNLVVAATGTGKTVVAALDYRRQREGGVTPRLLFLAHRAELLAQARETFRHALTDGSFGELLTKDHEPERWDHVFATVQSFASRDLLARLGPEHFRYVVIDECHHAPADSYQAIVPHLRPAVMLGLTATPERSDERSLLPDFDGHVAAELRLWHALERQLLVPFEYFGLADQTDLRRVRWRRNGYDPGDLGSLYTGDEARVDLVVRQLWDRVDDPQRIRALAFCASVEHAEFMAKALSERGLPAMAIHGGSSKVERADAPRRLRAGEVVVLCTCDLYNEGVDLPFVDTLLLLRPTQSATVFVQQLGRGLRLHEGKTSCLVLDFVGAHRSEFRYDAILSAVTGIPRARLIKAVEQGFPFLPSGCVLQLDPVARQRVLESLRASAAKGQRLASELRELATQLSRAPTLAEYLRETERELDDVYRNDGSWTRLRRGAGLSDGQGDEAEDLARRLGWLRHVDEPSRLRAWVHGATAAAEGGPLPASTEDQARLVMLGFQLDRRGIVRDPANAARYVGEHDEVRQELRELADVLQQRVGLAEEVYPVPEWPLALHRHYTRRELLAAVGYAEVGKKGRSPQGGILKLPEHQRELLLVTLDKSGDSFSPTTRYRDYAIDRRSFHWETQSIASVHKPSGRRYIDSPGNGWSFFLFVRETPDDAYAFLGPVTYRAHAGDRPISITWDLAHPLPASLYERYATLASS